MWLNFAILSQKVKEGNAKLIFAKPQNQKTKSILNTLDKNIKARLNPFITKNWNSGDQAYAKNDINYLSA